MAGSRRGRSPASTPVWPRTPARWRSPSSFPTPSGRDSKSLLEQVGGALTHVRAEIRIRVTGGGPRVGAFEQHPEPVARERPVPVDVREVARAAGRVPRDQL